MKERLWLDALEPRERMEVLHAENYVQSFNHGTSGHLMLVTLAKVTAIADALSDGVDSQDELRTLLANMLSAPKIS